MKNVRLLALNEDSDIEIKSVLSLREQIAKLGAALQLSQTILRLILAGWVILYFYPSNGTEQKVWVAILIYTLTAILIWLFEFMVKTVILKDPEAWAVRLSPIAKTLTFILSPILVLPLKLSHAEETARELSTITEDELKTMIDEIQRSGEIELDESEMIQSVFRFDETLAREIMIPRVDILALDVETPLEEAADTVIESGYSRVPVYKDHTDNLLGLLYAKDMLKVFREGSKINSLQDLLRPIFFIPETKLVDELLDELQTRRTHMAIVVDEYGGVAGLVTIEDIVEEIFGEIEDEYDEEEEAHFQQVGPGEFLFHGRFNLDEVNDLLGTSFEAEDADTIGGLIYTRLGRVPYKGEIIKENDWQFTVVKLDERKIRQIRLKNIKTEATSEDLEKEDADA
jgi:putative hemolysin